MAHKNQRPTQAFLTAEQVGCDEEEATHIFECSLEELITQVTILPDWYEHNSEITEER